MIRKILPLMLTLLLLVACSPTPKAKRIKQVNVVDSHIVRNCSYLGEVRS